MNNKLKLSLIDFVDRGGQNDVYLARDDAT